MNRLFAAMVITLVWGPCLTDTKRYDKNKFMAGFKTHDVASSRPTKCIEEECICIPFSTLIGAFLGPSALMYGLGGLGFTAAGIQLGSLAATMMQFAAVAGAGGGLVALLQSIGAVGLGPIGIVMAIAGGLGAGYFVGIDACICAGYLFLERG